MASLKRSDSSIQIQVKTPGGMKSKSFTIYNSTVEEIFNRIYYMFDGLEKVEKGVSIYHHK